MVSPTLKFRSQWDHAPHQKVVLKWHFSSHLLFEIPSDKGLAWSDILLPLIRIWCHLLTPICFERPRLINIWTLANQGWLLVERKIWCRSISYKLTKPSIYMGAKDSSWNILLIAFDCYYVAFTSFVTVTLLLLWHLWVCCLPFFSAGAFYWNGGHILYNRQTRIKCVSVAAALSTSY